MVSSGQFWYIPVQSPTAHIHFMLKAVIVGTSWILAYFALKNLPITIVTPIRASVLVGIGLAYSGSR